MILYCVECAKDVNARLTCGREVYPHRTDLFDIPFWRCDVCGNFVGCHHKTKNRTAPLGCIPNKNLKTARIKLHAVIDPIWQSGKMNRRELYEEISNAVGWNYHTAKIRSIDEARTVYIAVRQIAKRLEKQK